MDGLTMPFKLLTSIILIFYACTGLSLASTIEKYKLKKTLELKKHFKTKKPWKVSVYEDYRLSIGKTEHHEFAPAKICFWYNDATKHKNCLFGKNKRTKGQNYNYYSLDKIEIKTIQKTPKKIKAVEIKLSYMAQMLGDSATHLSLWRYNKKTDQFINTLQPAIVYHHSFRRYITSSDYRLLNNVDGQSVIAIAKPSGIGGKPANDAYESWREPYYVKIYVLKNSKYRPIHNKRKIRELPRDYTCAKFGN